MAALHVRALYEVLTVTDDTTRKQARAILQACMRAWAHLRGPGPANKRAAAAAMCFSAYTKHGILSPHVRDVYYARSLRSIEPALHTLAARRGVREGGGLTERCTCTHYCTCTHSCTRAQRVALGELPRARAVARGAWEW